MAITAALSVCLGASVAVAGDTSQFGDDDNDYEGRIEQKKRSYFGFDLKSGGDKVSGVTAYFKFDCKGYSDGEALFEAKKDSLPVENKKFDGVVKHTYVNDQARRGSTVPKNVTVIYDVTGKLENGGDASGTVDAKLKGKLVGGGEYNCKATSDGKWKAEKGADIDAPLPPIVEP